MGPSWLLGRSVRERHQQERRAVEAVAAEARTRERLHLAGEVHDIVSHTPGEVTAAHPSLEEAFFALTEGDRCSPSSAPRRTSSAP
ncbi:hypothetical protein [Nocardiopsis sp. N85]|uniref:hypothetical protein n=1 Tax=Nocardiopsis sp. N85 TaxID=3029400 RepID=UPI00237F1354|nr:hypothetical protein [Nocardiopsis sp. N85]